MHASPAKAGVYRSDGTNSGEIGPGFPHGTSLWAEGLPDSGRAPFHVLRVGHAGGELEQNRTCLPPAPGVIASVAKQSRGPGHRGGEIATAPDGASR